ncbi:GNAT family N-acetyltransferase [Rhizobium sp. GN54]|uniref:GNAT family N-acetyltransferase n=1 Tax=Rhizobium sp. GN54 TaxID=2898150 RepID=UPI001E543C0C|nr:GNAT family N-acetyltransferase [Rhizobium sp. GN54]MCD2181933.1 GNAT family N-acetyltransferase [Rhizobium sp. GN54]
MLADGYSKVAPGKLVAAVTCLEMLSPTPTGNAAEPEGLTLALVREPDLDWYRDLYRRIGTDWLWSSRLSLAEGALAEILHDPAVEVRAVMAGGRAEGLMELDFREEGQCELTFFGLTKAMIGRGAGRWLMNQAIENAWSKPVSRFWVHTCSLDSPQALDFYVRSGFVPYERMVEVFDDPRLVGILPADAAPQVPILRGGALRLGRHMA